MDLMPHLDYPGTHLCYLFEISRCLRGIAPVQYIDMNGMMIFFYTYQCVQCIYLVNITYCQTLYYCIQEMLFASVIRMATDASETKANNLNIQ